MTLKAQDQAWSKLLTLSSAMPQSLVLVGPPGVGKKLAAVALYQWIHCASRMDKAPCEKCISCVKIAQGRHSDLILIQPKGEQILVDDLREMQKMLFFPPLEGKLRLVLIEDAHQLNASSANTILKTLEEPPAHTRFILITHERGLLLPTIVSRSQFVYFTALDPRTQKELLQQIQVQAQVEIPEKLMPVVLQLMGGGLDRAKLFTDEKVLEFLQATLPKMQSHQDWASLVRLAEQLGPEEWKLELFLDLLLCREHQQAQTQSVGKLSAAHQTSNLAMTAVHLRRRLSRYANRKLIALAAAQLLGEAR